MDSGFLKELLASQPEMSEPLAHDPRWEWIEITTMGSKKRKYIQGPCRHVETVPVTSCMTGELLAHLCLTCDEQLA